MTGDTVSADEMRARGVPAALAPQGRRGPRHAAPRKPLSARFHMPAGKAIALAAMPTAVLMGMGFTPTLAQADEQPKSRSLTADEYKDCLAALEDTEDTEDAEDGTTASAGPSAPAGDPAAPDEETPAAEPDPPASRGGGPAGDPGTDADEGTDGGAGRSSSSSSDAGSGERGGAAPAGSGAFDERAGGPGPTPSETGRDALEELGDALKDFFTPKDRKTGGATASPTPSATASAASGAAGEETGPPEETAGKPAETAGKPAGTGDGAAGEAEEEEPAAAADDGATATPRATASPNPSPSASATTDADDCPVATDAEGGVDNRIPLPEDPWFLNASSLLLTGADYQGVVEVRTASGRTKKVLKYVVSQGTDIGDLHQTVEDKQSGTTHHVRAARGSTSTIRDGETVMYTESISGKLLGLIQVTFDPENPPPLNIPLVYFTDVTVQQAGQFGGTLHIPGLRQYVD